MNELVFPQTQNRAINWPMDDSTANPSPPQSSFGEYEYEYESEDDYEYNETVITGNGGQRRLARIGINEPIADIVRDCVLHRLPARSLFRFRAVDTSWSSFITSPIFPHTQSRTYRSISGVFCSDAFGPTVYAPFPPAAAHALPNDPLSILPASSVKVLSSSSGLVLCFCPSSRTFFICNPAHGSWAAVPKPPCNPGFDPAAVLLFLPDVYNFSHDFHIVIAFQIDGVPERILGFQIFSSSCGGWWVSHAMCEVENLYPKSGVTAGGAAFWQTSMNTVVRYELAEDTVGVVPWPMGHVTDLRWAIGVMGGGSLYGTAVTEEAIQVHKLLDKSDKWELVAYFDLLNTLESKWDELEGGEEVAPEWDVGADADEEEKTEWNMDWDGNVVFNPGPLPLRFVGGEMEILLWFKGKVVGVDLTTKRVRVAGADSADLRGFVLINCVPYVSTLAALPPLATIDGGTEAAMD